MICEHRNREPCVFQPLWWCKDCRKGVPMDDLSAARWRIQWDALVSQLRDAKALLEESVPDSSMEE